MVNNMEKLRNTINTILGWACVFVFAVMVVVGTYQIVVRYFFNNPSTVSEELLTYSFTWMALLSTALVFGKRDHMRMGFLADKVTGQKKKVLEIGIEVLIILFALVVMVYGGISIMKLTMTQITANDSNHSVIRRKYGIDLYNHSFIRHSNCHLWHYEYY